ncbi:MAG: eIF2A-related protein [Limnospira sp.]
MVGKLVVLKLDGDLEEGMRVTFEIGEEGTRPQAELVRQISPYPEIGLQYKNWRSTYRRLGMQSRAIKGAKATIDGSIQKRREDCHRSAAELERCLNQWLIRESFLPIREKWSEILSPPWEEARILIRTSCPELRKIPWQIWDFLERYPNAEVALSSPESERPPKAKVPTERDKVRILAILGDSRGINVEEDRQFLNGFPDAVTTFLAQPERQEINDRLWEQTWDILFFAGHSRTEGERGRIYINPTDSLSLGELREGLRKSIANGLQIAIFNSCDGLGLAGELEQLHVPQLIVMREPVPDRVAQQFIKSFLSAFSGGKSFYLAEREARLRLGVLENQFPNASWLPTICQNSAAVPPTWEDLGRRPTERCPYRGLFAFREEDARFFFGRDAFTKILVEAIAKQPFVAVIGPSGSGKSSVVFAGLIPNLPGGASWRPIAFRPGDRPLNALAGALIRAMEPNLSQSDRLFKTRQLADHLRQKEGGLRDVADEFARDNPETRLLLVADQFEELYTLCRDSSERRVFLDRLIEAVERPFNFRLAITLRADFLGQALSYRRFADALQYADLKLGPMNRDEMERAIAKPAELLGVTVEEGLTKRILDAVGPSSGDLPLLEFALTQLWEKQGDNQLSHATYDAIGGVERALARHAEEAYRQLDEEEKERTQQIFIQLVKPGDETEDTRRLATRGEVGEENWDLVTRLASARLVVTDTRGETGEETVEIVHEALIKGWFRLSQWLEVDRAFRTWQERSRAALKQWQASDRDEGALLRGAPLAEAEGWLKERPGEISAAEKAFIRRGLSVRSRQRRVFILGLSVGLAVALVLTGTATWLWWREQRQRKETEIREGVASAETRLAFGELWEGRIEAIEVAKKFQQMNRVEPQTWGQVYGLLYQAIGGDGFQEKNRLEGYEEAVTSVSFSPEGETIATASGNTVQLWTREGKKLRTLTGHTDMVTSVSFSPNGETIASGSKDTTVKLWSREGTLIKTLQGHETPVYSVEFSPDGKAIASASIPNAFTPTLIAGSVKLWSREGSLLNTIKGEKAEQHGVISVSFSPDGEFLALAYPEMGNGNTGAVDLWSRQGELLQSWEESAWDVSFHPDSKTIAVASENKIQLLSRDGKKLGTLEGHTENVTSVIFSPSGRNLISTSLDKTVKVWDINKKEIIQIWEGHVDEIYRVDFSPNGENIATASADRTVKIWSCETINTLLREYPHLNFFLLNSHFPNSLLLDCRR